MAEQKLYEKTASIPGRIIEIRALSTAEGLSPYLVVLTDKGRLYERTYVYCEKTKVAPLVWREML